MGYGIKSKFKSKFIFFASPLLAACGAMDMPDVGGKPTSSDGSGVTPSGETEFDLTKCGFDVSKPDAMISTTRMAMVPVSKTVTVQVLGVPIGTQAVTVSGMAINEDSLTRRVGSFSVQSTPQVQSPEIVELTSRYSGGFSADLMSLTDRAKIGSLQPEWKGVFCSFQPAVKIQKGTTERVQVELSKPMPVSPILTADLARIKSEIGVKRAWTSITAKVVDSTDPNVPMGSVWTGRVDSAPVASTVAIATATGRQTIQSELAVKMTYDFGSAEANRAIGLPKSVTWYISTATRSYKAMAVDFGDNQPVYYLPAK
jgi:hypothetical protein